MKTPCIILLCLAFLTTGVAIAQPASPQLTVELPGVGVWFFTGAASPPVTLQPIGGTLLDFVWSADASAYGGEIAGYRYGWDLMDPADPNDPGWTTAGIVPDLQAVEPVCFARRRSGPESGSPPAFPGGWILPLKTISISSCIC